MSETAEIIEHEPKPKRSGPRAVAIREERQAPVVTTPTEMLALAVQNGAGIETIERLVALQERTEAARARKEFAKAVSAAKAEIKPILRRQEGHNNKKYAGMADIADHIDPILHKYGLSYRHHASQADRISVTCILEHSEGHYEETTLSGPPDVTGNKNAIQAIGSTGTYLQRYTLILALGLSTKTADDDGRAAGMGETITDEQADQITDLLHETKSDVGAFLKWAGAESVSDIPVGKFQAAMDMLHAKKRKVQQ